MPLKDCNLFELKIGNTTSLFHSTINKPHILSRKGNAPPLPEKPFKTFSDIPKKSPSQSPFKSAERLSKLPPCDNATTTHISTKSWLWPISPKAPSGTRKTMPKIRLLLFLRQILEMQKNSWAPQRKKREWKSVSKFRGAPSLICYLPARPAADKKVLLCRRKGFLTLLTGKLIREFR